jgi:hypothetical protein
MQNHPKIYAASRASVAARSAMWRAHRAGGANILSSWIDEADEGATEDFGELWVRIEQEVRACDRLVLYAEAHDFPLKGALVEVGMALAFGKDVFVVTPGVALDPRNMRPLGSWATHPRVQFIDNVSAALYS